MKPKSIFLTVLVGLLAAAVPLQAAGPESARPSSDKTRDGVFQITLKSPDVRKMTADELVRDRDLNPGALYRVKTGGYLGFEEGEWVDKIEFKPFDLPVTEMPQYKKYAELMAEINERIWNLKETLAKYDLLALRLMDICDRTRFPSLQSIDENISQQLLIYKRLVLLRALVVNALNRFIKDRSCRDLYTDYQKTLEIYIRQLTELAKNYELLSRRAIALSKDVSPQPPADRPRSEQKPSDQKPEAPQPPKN